MPPSTFFIAGTPGRRDAETNLRILRDPGDSALIQANENALADDTYLNHRVTDDASSSRLRRLAQNQRAH